MNPQYIYLAIPDTNLEVSVKIDSEGVVVDVVEHDGEYDEVVASTWRTYGELETDETDRREESTGTNVHNYESYKEARDDLNLKRLALEHNIGHVTLFMRLQRGWSLERALNEPASTKNERLVQYDGEMVTLSELAQRTGLKYSTLYGRIVQQGWNVEKAVTTPVRNR